MDDREKAAKILIKNVENSRATFSKSEKKLSLQPSNDALKEIDLALDFMRQYLEFKTIQLSGEKEQTIQVVTHTPVFTLIVDLFKKVWIRTEKITLKYSENQENLIQSLLCDLNTDFLGFVEKTFKPSELNYSTMIITESSDLESATDVLAAAWHNIFLPWTIRNVLVQESVFPKFLTLVKPKLKPIDSCYLKDKELCKKITSAIEKCRKMGLNLIHNESESNPITSTIIQNVTREYFDEFEYLLPIVTLQVFRTAKEAATLANGSSGGSASIWSENISMAFELINNLKCNNVWVNCNGVLSAKFPFKFGKTIYGSAAGLTGNVDLNSEFIGNVHFQTMLKSDVKTIVIPFGTTFAN